MEEHVKSSTRFYGKEEQAEQCGTGEGDARGAGLADDQLSTGR